MADTTPAVASGLRGEISRLQGGNEGIHGAGDAIGVSGTGSSKGVCGRAQANANEGGNFDGGITVINGSKTFIEPHPTDPTREIRFVCLEGPESGTTFRGSARTGNVFATIEVPESFRGITDEKNLTVVAMPVGELAVMACVTKSLDKIVIPSSRDVDFDDVVNGILNEDGSIDRNAVRRLGCDKLQAWSDRE